MVYKSTATHHWGPGKSPSCGIAIFICLALLRNEAFHDELIGAWVLRWIYGSCTVLFGASSQRFREDLPQKNKQQINITSFWRIYLDFVNRTLRSFYQNRCTVEASWRPKKSSTGWVPNQSGVNMLSMWSHH